MNARLKSGSYPPYLRLKRRSHYQTVARTATHFVGKWVRVSVSPPLSSQSRLGIVVTKRYGSAPQRNRFKRLVREAFRTARLDFGCIVDVVVRPRSCALEACMQEIQQELLAFVTQAVRQQLRAPYDTSTRDCLS